MRQNDRARWSPNAPRIGMSPCRSAAMPPCPCLLDDRHLLRLSFPVHIELVDVDPGSSFSICAPVFPVPVGPVGTGAVPLELEVLDELSGALQDRDRDQLGQDIVNAKTHHRPVAVGELLLA